MFWTRVRVSPCSALWRLSSLGRSTLSEPLSSVSFISGCSVRRSSPLGPFTATVLPWRSRFTPLGTVTGFLPIRDIARLLPDYGEELAAQVRAAGLAVGHQPLRGRDDRHAQAVLDPGQLARLHVAPEPGRGHAPQLPDHRGLVVV